MLNVLSRCVSMQSRVRSAARSSVYVFCVVARSSCFYRLRIHLHLHLVILQMLLSKATYNWGIHKAINLEEANRQRKCS